MIPFLLQSPSPFKDPVTWAALIVALCATGYVYLRARLKKKDPLARPAPAMSLAQQRAVERQMQNLLVELSEMARQVSAQLDTRAAKLELLLQEADAKLAALRAATDQQAPLVAEAPFPPPAHDPQPSAPPLNPEPRTPNPPPEADPRHAAIYLLADQGLAAQDIATRLDRPKGEIELILALRPRA